MLHPFSGQNVQREETPAEPTRRQVLGTMVFAAGAVAVAVPALVHGQIAITNAVGEAARGPIATTLALGEEGALTAAANEAGRVMTPVTTEPFGEEAGHVTSRVQAGLEDGVAAVRPNQPLTKALPEEGRVTSLVVGEEGGKKPIPQPRPLTQALNEQGAVQPAPAAQVAAAIAAVQIAQQAQPAQPVQPGQIQIQIQVQQRVTTQALNEEAATRALREGGITRALNEGGIGFGAIVTVQPLAKDLSEAQLKAAFADLGASDPGKALQACAVLYGSKQALTFLKDHLKFEMAKADATALARLIKDLDSDDFETREKAEKDLEKLGMAASTALQAALDNKDASTEVKMRAKRLIEKFKDNSPILQAQRGVEVLIALNTPEAKTLIETLAKGNENDLVVPVAKKALDRIKK